MAQRAVHVWEGPNTNVDMSGHFATMYGREPLGGARNGVSITLLAMFLRTPPMYMSWCKQENHILFFFSRKAVYHFATRCEMSIFNIQ